jgi:hypothetical protein
MMSEQTILNNAFKTVFTPESIRAPEEPYPPEDDLIRQLIDSGRVGNGKMVANIEVRGMTRVLLDRFADVTLALLSSLLWKHSIYANDPTIADYEAFCDKLEELTKRRLFVAIKSEKTGDMNDDTIIEEAFLGVSFGQMDHSKCNSCPTCIAEKRALIKKNVDAALKKRAEAEAETEADLTSTCINCKKIFTFADKENYPDCCSDKCKAQDMYFVALKEEMESLAPFEFPNSNCIKLPIRAIDDIPVSVTIIRFNHDMENFHLEITLDSIAPFYDTDQAENTRLYIAYTGSVKNKKNSPYETIKGQIQMLMDEEECYFDVVRSRFLLGKGEIEKHLKCTKSSSLFEKAYSGKKGRKLYESENCCVCDEKTHSKTNCKHSLCLRCLVKIDAGIEKQEDDDDDEERVVPCPMCRQDMTCAWNQ